MARTLSLRTHAPALWAEIVRVAREDIGLADWTEDQLATVIAKIHAPDPDLLPDHIGAVLIWCKAAQDGPDADDDTRATVSLWQHPQLPIVVTVQADGRVAHRIDPDVTVEFVP